jgi:lysophospholipase
MHTATTPMNRRAIPADATETMWHAADGWPIRRIDWQASTPPRGSLLFLPGRGDHYEKYLETLAYYADAGWHVTAIDWRGQGASGRLLDDPQVGHIDDFATWIADLRTFWDAWKRKTPAPHVVIAHSMGGQLAMRALVEKAMDPDAVALSAPMLGIQTGGLPLALNHAVAKLIVALGKGKQAAWKVSEKPLSPMSMRGKMLTHDDDRYELGGTRDGVHPLAGTPRRAGGGANAHLVARDHGGSIGQHKAGDRRQQTPATCRNADFRQRGRT